MTLLAKRGSGTPVTSGTVWTLVTSAVDGTPGGANPGTFATWTSSTSLATAYIEVSGYDFSAIPDVDPLNSVTVDLRHIESNTTRIPTVTLQAFAGATPLGTPFACVASTGARNDTTTVPVTLAQLKAANFKVRATATRAANTQSATFRVDHIDVTANYGILGGKIKVWTGAAWAEKPVKVWSGSTWVEKPVKVWTGSAWVLS